MWSTDLLVSLKYDSTTEYLWFMNVFVSRRSLGNMIEST